MGLWQDACKTIICTKSHLHSSKRYVRWCIFCKKRCKGIELTVKCDCPGYNGPEERRICHEQYQLPVNMLNDDEDEAEEGRSRMVSDEGETTTSPVGTDLDDLSSSQATSSQDDDGSDESYAESDKSSDRGVATSESTPPAVLPDKVESSSPTIKKEEEDTPTDNEDLGIKLEYQVVKKEEDTIDDEGTTSATNHTICSIYRFAFVVTAQKEKVFRILDLEC